MLPLVVKLELLAGLIAFSVISSSSSSPDCSDKEGCFRIVGIFTAAETVVLLLLLLLLSLLLLLLLLLSLPMTVVVAEDSSLGRLLLLPLLLLLLLLLPFETFKKELELVVELGVELLCRLLCDPSNVFTPESEEDEKDVRSESVLPVFVGLFGGTSGDDSIGW